MSFYDEVLRELLVALGAALFLGNALALVRGRRTRPEGVGTDNGDAVVERAPILRTASYALMGLIVMVWGIASLATS